MKVIIIGRTGCGKTTLAQALNGLDLKYIKTQSVGFIADCIDTPGEYMENRFYYRALIASSYDSGAIFLVHAADDINNSYPPGFAHTFSKPIYGIITKTDTGGSAGIKRAERFLLLTGTDKIYRVSAITGEGIDDLKELYRQ